MDGPKYSPEIIARWRKQLDQMFGPVLDPQPTDEEVLGTMLAVWQLLMSGKRFAPAPKKEVTNAD